MKTQVDKLTENTKLTSLCCILTAASLVAGCNIFGFLASPGPFENRKAPAFDLQAKQDRKTLVWIEAPRSLNLSEEMKDKLAGAFAAYLMGAMEFKPQNVILLPKVKETGVQDPAGTARSLGAGFVLLVQVDSFELDSLQMKNYFAGRLVTRAILLDADLSTAVWPENPEGKMVHIEVEVETGGRDAAISRLVSGAAHCTLRHLYPCERLKFKHSDERVSTQEAFEIETYQGD